MAFTTVLPLHTYPAGTASGTSAIASGLNLITIQATRNSWPATGSDVISCNAEISYDNGITFEFLAGFTTSGGDIFRRGVLQGQSNIEIPLPRPELSTRVVRVTLTTFVKLQTSIAIQVI